MAVALSRERGSKLPGVGQDLFGQASLSHGSADRNQKHSRAPSRRTVALSRERGSKRSGQRFPPRFPHVALSRERGSKHGEGHDALVERRRSLTGARIETLGSASRSTTLKVALSRERGSKHRPAGAAGGDAGRSLTGARIETLKRYSSSTATARRSLTGARIETGSVESDKPAITGRSLTGARIETSGPKAASAASNVALSRERGSKLRRCQVVLSDALSLSHGSADRNRNPRGQTR